MAIRLCIGLRTTIKFKFWMYRLLYIAHYGTCCLESDCSGDFQSKGFSFVQMLLEEGASITAETVDGWTPLHSACHWNSASCAEKLISVGADVNRKSQGGNVLIAFEINNLCPFSE